MDRFFHVFPGPIILIEQKLLTLLIEEKRRLGW